MTDRSLINAISVLFTLVMEEKQCDGRKEDQEERLRRQDEQEQNQTWGKHVKTLSC
jgi:hypothetical protein